MDDKSTSRLSAILQNVINSEINLRSGDLNLVEQNINAVREALNRLRRAVCADFYDDNSKTTLQKPPHRTVKSTFAGKRPIKREVVTSEDETSSSIAASTFSPAIPQSTEKFDLVQIKVEKEEEVIEETNRVNSVALAESSLKYVDPDEKLSLLGRSDKGPRPRYVPPVMPINHIKHGLAPRLAERMKKVRILVRNNSKFLGNADGSSGGLYRWTVYVTLNDVSLDISQLVSKVVFYLHPSYRPNDVVTIGCPPFKITRRGWGEFDIRTKIFFINEADEPVDIMHAVVFDKLRSGMETFGGETIFDHWITNPSSTYETGVKNTTSECLERMENNPASKAIKKEPAAPTDLDNFLYSKLSTNKFNDNFGDIEFTEFFDLFDNENSDGPLKLTPDSLISEENLVPCKEESVILESDKGKNVESNFVEKVSDTPELQLDDNHKTVDCQSTKSSSEMPNAESFDLDDILGTCNEVVITDTCDTEMKTESEDVHVETDKAISSSKDVTEHIDYDNVKMEDLIKFPKILNNSSSDSTKTIQQVDLTPLKSLSAPLQSTNIATCAKTNVVKFIPATASSPTSSPASNLKLPIRQKLVPLQTRPTGPQPVRIINVTPKSAAAASAGTKCYIKMPDGSLKQIILKSSVMPKVNNLKVASPIGANVTSDRIITPNTSKPVFAIKRAGTPIVGPPVKILGTNAVVKVAGNVINSLTNQQLETKKSVQLVRCDKGKVLSSSNIVVSPQPAKVIRPGTNVEQKRPTENEEIQNVNVVERLLRQI